MMVKFLDLSAQYQSIKPEIDSAIASVIKESAFIGGKFVKEFEQQFAAYITAKYCVSTGNGTDALEIAIEALALPKHSEIIVPANSFIASSEAVTRCGHRVVFADVDKECYTLTAETVKAKLTSKTTAIIAVHLYGHPCDMDPLTELARTHNLRIIEDCAQSHGAEYKGRKTGTLGDIASFSFYPGKNLGAYGDGGAITTNDERLATRSRMIANHGRIAKYDHGFEGRNSRLDGIQAAILTAKLQYLERWTEQRIHIANQYIDKMHDIRELTLPIVKPWARQVYHLFVVRSFRKNELKDFLADKGIETGIHYPIALPKLAAYKYLNQAEDDFFANTVDKDLLSLPIGEHLTDADVDDIVKYIRQFFCPDQNG
jgi:dTDP-4-amino-4,6-dideoxygalactose transaminase